MVMVCSTSVILAAGRGSRLDVGDADATYSKPLIELDGMTLLERAVASCRRAGMRRIRGRDGFRADRVEADLSRYDCGDLETVFNPIGSSRTVCPCTPVAIW